MRLSHFNCGCVYDVLGPTLAATCQNCGVLSWLKDDVTYKELQITATNSLKHLSRSYNTKLWNYMILQDTMAPPALIN
jgi:hypothetical protein